MRSKCCKITEVAYLQSLATIFLVLVLAFGGVAKAWSPGTGSPTAVQGFSVDTTSRLDVLSYYNTVYTASQNFAAEMDWTGNVSTATAGTTSLTFKEDVRRRVNFYRALAGLGANITFDNSTGGDSDEDQLDALMNSAANGLSHTPGTTYPDYTAGGALAASRSNLALGNYGPDAVDAYLTDDGSNNSETGHRRWILYTMATVMGTGDIPPNGTYNSANALWVISNFNSAPAQFVTWPNSGYTPFPLLPARWSLSYPNADFTNAVVTMTQGTTSIPVTYDSRTDNGFGDNTLVWEPANLPTSLTGDTTYTVTVSGIAGVNGVTSHTYTVTLFDPNVLGQSVAISGSSTPPVAGAPYSFTGISDADAYDLQVSTGSTAGWNEGAEASPMPQIAADTTGSYPLIQSALVHSGSKAFQLAFPSDVDSSNDPEFYDFSDQSFEVTRQIIPSATSMLQFYDLCHYAESTSTLSAQVSSDGGNTWTQVWSRAGVGGSSSNWDPAFIFNQVSLAAYAGQVILVQFVLSSNNQGIFLGTTSDFGFFLDDITVTNSTQLTGITDTTLAGSATSFTLNSTTAGSALQPGISYYLRVRPEVGLRYYGFGTFDRVTPTATTFTGFGNWVSMMYPAITGGETGDDSGDGIPNGLKYAFGLNPTTHNAGSALPTPVKADTSLTLSFTAPAGIGGVTYGAQSSTDLVHWTAVTDTGTGNSHIFTVGSAGANAFLRQSITIAP